MLKLHHSEAGLDNRFVFTATAPVLVASGINKIYHKAYLLQL